MSCERKGEGVERGKRGKHGARTREGEMTQRMHAQIANGSLKVRAKRVKRVRFLVMLLSDREEYQVRRHFECQ